MKKILFFVAAVAALSFASCDGQAEATQADTLAVDSCDTVEVADTAVVDTLVLDTVAE